MERLNERRGNKMPNKKAGRDKRYMLSFRVNEADYRGFMDLADQCKVPTSKLIRLVILKSLNANPEYVAGSSEEVQRLAKIVGTNRQILKKLARLIDFGKVKRTDALTNALSETLQKTQRLHQKLQSLTKLRDIHGQLPD